MYIIQCINILRKSCTCTPSFTNCILPGSSGAAVRNPGVVAPPARSSIGTVQSDSGGAVLHPFASGPGTEVSELKINVPQLHKMYLPLKFITNTP